MTKEQDRIIRENAPRDELAIMIQEATVSVETDLALEDAGWINLSGTTADVVTAAERIINLRLSRRYYTLEPLARQSIRLWTDYTFGPGMTWQVGKEENKKTREVLEKFWNSTANQPVLSARGQRKSSDKILVDGEIFFAIFLGVKGEEIIRWIDPLEITEIITNPEDKEDVRYYRREWTDSQGTAQKAIYRSTTNIKDVATQDQYKKPVTKTEDALIYHLTQNTISQRGNPLMLPALKWIKYYNRFLASRIAIMLALSRFALKQKVTGGQAQVNAIKAKTHQQDVPAGSTLLENLGVETTVMKQETGASSAYQDGRMIKHMIFAAVGIPEQYFGDISTGNLATAKTVELPMMKMFKSYQRVWADTYQDINEVILAHNNVPPDKWYVDMEFPPIAPADVAQIALSLKDIITILPEFAYSPDVQQIAMLALGVNDPAEALEAIKEAAKSNPDIKLAKVLRVFKESLIKKEW